MKPKHLFPALLLTSVLGFFVYQSLPEKKFQHIFINETQDHRFDESIQVSILSAYNRTKVQNIVVITDRFPVAEFSAAALKLFHDLGKSNQGRSILYLFSPKEKALKIEVGYSLEGKLPDSRVHFLEKAAKSFIYRDRYQDFWAELINTLNIEIQDQEKGIQDIAEDFDFSKHEFVSGGAGVLSIRYDASAEQLEKEMSRPAPMGGEQFPASSTLEASLRTYLETLSLGIGFEQLGVLSKESRLFRQFTPMTSYQLYRNAKMYAKAGVDRIFQEGNFGFIFFRQNQPVLPLVFHKELGDWKVQEPLSWSIFQRFEDSSRVFLKFPLHVKSAPLSQYLAQTFGRPLYEGPELSLEKLYSNNPEAPVNYFYFKLFWLERVEQELEKMVPLVDNDLLNIASDTANNLGHFSKFLTYSRMLVEKNPQKSDLKRNYEFYKNTLQFTGAQWKLSL